MMHLSSLLRIIAYHSGFPAKPIVKYETIYKDPASKICNSRISVYPLTYDLCSKIKRNRPQGRTP